MSTRPLLITFLVLISMICIAEFYWAGLLLGWWS